MKKYEALAEILRMLKGNAAITRNDHPDIRGLLDWMPHEVVPIRYTSGGSGLGAGKSLIGRGLKLANTRFRRPSLDPIFQLPRQ